MTSFVSVKRAGTSRDGKAERHSRLQSVHAFDYTAAHAYRLQMTLVSAAAAVKKLHRARIAARQRHDGRLDSWSMLMVRAGRCRWRVEY